MVGDGDVHVVEAARARSGPVTAMHAVPAALGDTAELVDVEMRQLAACSYRIWHLLTQCGRWSGRGPSVLAMR